MTGIIQHIEYLLQHNDCVILPGIGAIVVEHIPAGIDFEKGVITPPTRIIGLNQAIRHDDGMIATSIARSERMKFEEARAIMLQELGYIRLSLERDHYFRLGKIGSLRIDDEGLMEFIPRLSPEEMSEEMGAPALSIRNKKGREECEIPATDATLLQAENLPPHCYTKILSDRNYYIAVNKIFARCAAALIVIMAVVFPFIIPQPAGGLREVSASMNPVETLASHQAAPSRISGEPISSEEDIDTDPSSEDNQTEISTITPTEGLYLIVATFHSQNETENFINSRQGSIFTLTPIERNGIWRVSAGHGDTATLRTLLNSSEFRASFSEAWIWDSEK